MTAAFLRRRFLIIFLFLPNLLSIVYFGLIASPVYKSTASLTVSNPSQSSSNLTSILSGGSGDGSAEGAYIFKEYVKSWDEFRKINGRIDLDKNYSNGDIIGRYGGLVSLFMKNDVALWKYYKNNVDVAVDLKSGIASLEVRGHQPDFATRLARTVLGDAISHMNDMNLKQEEDSAANAEGKKAAIQSKVHDDEVALAALRAKIGVYDLKEQYLSKLSLVNTLASKDADLESQYETIRQAAPNSPEVQNLASAISVTRLKMADAKSQFAILGQESARYETLVTSRDNDVNLLQQASLAAQEAHQKSAQNKYYMGVISQPSQPETPELPHRLLWIGGIFIATLFLWGLLR